MSLKVKNSRFLFDEQPLIDSASHLLRYFLQPSHIGFVAAVDQDGLVHARSFLRFTTFCGLAGVMPFTSVFDGVCAVSTGLEGTLLVDFGNSAMDELTPRGFVNGVRLVRFGGVLRGLAGELLDELEKSFVVVAQVGGEGVNFFNNVLHLNSNQHFR
jgi:hypothetical protein